MSIPDEINLCDEAGNILGRSVPSNVAPPELDITDDEVRRQLAADRKTYSTAEVLAHLKGIAS